MTTLFNLFARAQDAKRIYEALAARNTYGLTNDEQVQLDFDYEMARIAVIDSSADYREALRQEALPRRDIQSPSRFAGASAISQSERR